LVQNKSTVSKDKSWLFIANDTYDIKWYTAYVQLTSHIFIFCTSSTKQPITGILLCTTVLYTWAKQNSN